ncbi:MAG: valine--tRNA ligase, partial [Planctomycetes bacterium]|nr:valine--tRNA ligase [Planctomycetota bacterium]
DEVEHEDIHGHFWYMQYPLVEPVEIDGEAFTHVTIATTRPETMLGDTAVAMNPADPRAEVLVGRSIRLPIVGRKIPIIADKHVVLPDPDSEDEKAKFSTGFLKVTPAHDPDDWEIGQRHGLDVINVMAPDGTISDRYGWDDAAGTDAEQFLALDRFEARKAIVEWFRAENLLEDIRDYVHPVGHSYRSHVPIEPYLSDQWYIAVKKPIEHLTEKFGHGLIEDTNVPANSLAGLALQPVLDGRIKFTPERYKRTYTTWLENLRDWPISRQLWWGHQIPIWTKDLKLSPGPAQPGSDDQDDARTAAAVDQAMGGDAKAYLKDAGAYHMIATPHPEDPTMIRTYFCAGAGADEIERRLEQAGWTRDEDVLDTWFSSALWPFSTMGWPADTPEMKTFYPGNVLCTAREIITLWVTRMVMMGQYCAGDIPFTDVFIHAMIQDGEGRKMSKSLGNGIDPLVVIDSHGADAMRFTLASMTTQTQDIRMPVTKTKLPDGRIVNTSAKFDLGRNFCNKLWNASRFVMMNLKAPPAWSQIHPREKLSDAWILSRLNASIRDATVAVEAFRFNELADLLYHFTWDDLCDWYLEIAKARISAADDTPQAVLAYCLDTILRLLHPIMPFITEAIWQQLNKVAPLRGPGDIEAERILVTAHWPRADGAVICPPVEAEFDLLRAMVRQIRDVRRRHNVPPGREVDVILDAPADKADLFEENADLLKSQARLANVSFQSDAPAPPGAAAVAVEDARLYILDIIDRDAELARLRKQQQSLSNGISAIQAKLSSEGFVTKAPDHIVQGERDRLETLTAELASVVQSIESLE